MCHSAVRTYHSKLSAASANACSVVSAQCTMVNVAARSLANLPIGAARVCASRKSLIRSPSSSGGTPIVNESSPRPSSPAITWLAGLLDATQSGGCGFWSGFGCTRRGGTFQNVPSHSKTSSVHAPTIMRSASSHMGRVSFGIDAEALELGARRRPTGAELDPAVGDDVEDRAALRGADRVVERSREEPDAVADAQTLGPLGDRSVEVLG